MMAVNYVQNDYAFKMLIAVNEFVLFNSPHYIRIPGLVVQCSENKIKAIKPM